jgi:uncharacterized protein YdhG (YjbR/CyaY superfamily)
MDKTRYQSVDEYIKAQRAVARPALKLLRETINNAAPDAVEVISYNMPALKFHGILLYYAAHTAHLGLYAMPGAIIAFREKIAKYVSSKATIQFPYSDLLPVKLITDIVKFRVKENLSREEGLKLKAKSLKQKPKAKGKKTKVSN